MSLFDLSKMKDRIEELETKTVQEGFWNDTEISSVVLQEIKYLKNKYEKFTKINTEVRNLEELNNLLLLEEDNDLVKELLRNTRVLEHDLEKFEIETLLSGKYDRNNAIVTLHPGAGGTESQDWAEMLYRMYSRWANANGYSVKELDYLEGEEAGIKSATFLISGENAYGYLKSEIGIHRLVRISPFDAGGRGIHRLLLLKYCQK